MQAEDLDVNKHVKNKNLGFHKRCQRQEVKELCEVCPHVGRTILAQALIVEAIDLSNLPAFVIAAQNTDAVGIPNL